MRSPSKLIASPALVAIAAALAAAFAASASAAAPPAMTVVVHPASGATGSYFTLSPKPGHSALAGTLEVRNRLGHRIVVRIDPVASLTASTLGSAYATAVAENVGQAAWMRLGARRLVLGPRQNVSVPVAVNTPPDVKPGDYLSGISVEAQGNAREARLHGNIAVSSVQRYAVGLLVDVPGPRHPLIRLTSAKVTREPAGLTFYLHGTNAGNAILQNVRGTLLITRGRRTVARAKIGPGTFVTGTSIDYPLLVPLEQPREGAVYRVRAVMRYHGGIARFDNGVSFGHEAAQAQQDFGGRPLTDSQSKTSLWLIIAAGLGCLVGLVGLLLFARRKRTPGARVALRALEAASAHAAAAHEPLSLVRIADSSGATSTRKLARAARSHLRPTDRLYRIGESELLVLMPLTRLDAARAVCSDLPLLLSRSADLDQVVIRVVEANGLRAEILLDRLREARVDQWDDYDLPLDSLTSGTPGERV
jgi:hypothetical protein